MPAEQRQTKARARPAASRSRSRPKPGTLAHDLERGRLRHRAGRIERVLVAMRALAGTHGEALPAALGSGIDDFARELSRARQQLRELDDGRDVAGPGR